MLAIERLLFPTDFSPCAAQALDLALDLAVRTGAELHMLHAVVYRGDDPNSPEAHFPEPEELLERLDELARDRLAELARDRPGQLRIEEVRRRGHDAGPVILDYAREADIDLIVLGTHGRRGAHRFLLGSVAQEVLRLSRCPVLTLSQRQEPPKAEAVERILAPVDFSRHSRQGLAHARELAGIYGGRVELLHVLEENPRPVFYGTLGAVPEESLLARLRQEAEAELEALGREVLGSQVPWKAYVARGRAASVIAGFAEDTASDLVVLASHGLGGLERLLLGSTTEAVVRAAGCPVLTVKSFGKSLVG